MGDVLEPIRTDVESGGNGFRSAVSPLYLCVILYQRPGAAPWGAHTVGGAHADGGSGARAGASAAAAQSAIGLTLSTVQMRWDVYLITTRKTLAIEWEKALRGA